MKKKAKVAKTKAISMKNAKPKAIMCKSFKHYGFALLGIGACFLALNMLLGANSLRIWIVVFFGALGLIDLLLYGKYGEG